MYDIDYFKNINDTYGHLIGDQVLIKMSNLVLHYIRDVDILARWGGEEFMILLPETNLKGALIVAQNIRKAIEEASFSQHFKKTITASFGVYEFHKDDTVDNLLQKVDSLLYEAKDSGRNKVCS
jgi:diguanylate cyclase (GGDEF)-like protein